MSELKDQAPDFQPDIPLHLKVYYNHLSEIERSQYDMANVQHQQNSWIMQRLVEAGQHRTHINQRVDKLAEDVQPVIQLTSALKSIKSKLVALIVLILVPMGLAVFGAWLERKFGTKP